MKRKYRKLNNIRDLIEKYSYLNDISSYNEGIENFCYYNGLKYDEVIEMVNEFMINVKLEVLTCYKWKVLLNNNMKVCIQH